MDAANKLILLAGLPRSGTSWLGKIFDSHPDTAYRSEPDNFPNLEDVPLFPGVADADRYRRSVNEFAAGLARLSTYRHAAKPPLFPKSYRSPLRQRFFEMAALGARFGMRPNQDWPVPGARVDRVRPPPVLVWKSIRSLGRTRLLLTSLPNAKFIHLVRHPCGHIASILRGERQAALPDSSEHYGIFRLLAETPQGRRHRLTLDGLRGLTTEERLAWQWVLINEKAMDEAAQSKRARLVRYEDVCDDPVAAARELFAFCGLEWHAQTEAFIRESTSAVNQRYFSVFKNPAESANRWLRELDSGCIERIVAVVRHSEPLARLYGLTVDLPAASVEGSA